MRLIDVNILIHLADEMSSNFDEVSRWFNEMVASDIPVALTSSTISGFVRVSTRSPTIANNLTPAEAIQFLQGLLDTDCVLILDAGPNYWPNFKRLILESKATGNLVSDAHLAAIATEHDFGIITYDKDFARFPGVRYATPTA